MPKRNLRSRSILAVLAAGSMLSTGCSSEPEATAENVTWSVKRSADKKGFAVTGRASLAQGVGGWYQPSVTLLDSRGCSTTTDLKATHVVDTSARGVVEAKFDEVVPAPRSVATAQFRIAHQDAPIGSLDPASITSSTLYEETRVVDPKVKPPEFPVNACGKSRAQLREERQARLRDKAVDDPEGADAEAIAGMGREEVVATAINSAGYLCARITSMSLSGGDIIVDCVEYRSGQGRAKYRVDAEAGIVTPLS